MKAFIIRDKHGKLYMSLKTFSKKNGDWVGTGFIELNDEDVDEDNSFWNKVGGWFQNVFSMND